MNTPAPTPTSIGILARSPLRAFAQIAWLLALLLSVSAAAAQSPSDTPSEGPERIVAFESDITVRDDGTMRVTETITVIARGNQIQRGIFRDFPTMYRGAFGLRKSVPFEVVAVTRDGADEPYATEGIGGGVRIRVGDADRRLTPGRHTYAITYETANQLGYFADHDELYWHVTGLGWNFPIDRIAARVTLPAGVFHRDVRTEAFTGPEGSTAKDFSVEVLDDATVVFETTGPQPAYAGMSIVVGWPVGVIDRDAADPGIFGIVRANVFLATTTAGIIAMLIYLHVRWIRVGRDPAKGMITPRMEPPEGMSPGAVRFLRTMRHDTTCYAAGLFNLAVGGVLVIDETSEGEYAIERLDPDAEPAFPDEAAIAKGVLPDEGLFAYETENHSDIAASIAAQKASLKKDYGHLFSTNRGSLGWALLIVAVAWIVGILTLPLDSMMVAGFMSIWMGAWSLGCLALLIGVIMMWTSVFTKGKASKIVPALIVSLFALPFFAGWVFGAYMLGEATSIWAAPLLFVAGVIVSVYAFLLPAPTVEGRRLLDEIEGLRQYLKGREHGFGIDQDVYERLLPYSVALGLSEEWASQFEGVVEARLRAEGVPEDDWDAHRTWHPRWYRGEQLHSRGFLQPGIFATAVASSLSSSVSSSAAAPGSSSGFSSGSSGGSGGGGGGGGGGW